MIPKKIHYCWFGYNPKPKLIQKCIESWKKYMPDYEIIEWNESNYDFNKIEYIREAYSKKKWAFVVDYARFDILNTHGGIFLDTDVELLKPIPEEYLSYEGITGFESGGKIAPGLIYASLPKQKLLTEIMNYYQSKPFSTDETICDIVTKILINNGLVLEDKIQVISNIAIFPQEYFCCFDHETQLFNITENTISIHHYFASWSPWFRKLKFKSIKLLASFLGAERYKKLKRIIKK